MGSPFDALVAGAVAPAITTTFGRTWRLTPMTRGADVNAAPVVDPARTALAGIEFRAALHEPPAKPIITDAYDPRTNRRPGTQAQHPLLRIQPDEIHRLALAVMAADLVLDVDSGVTWRVSSARTTVHGVRECDVHVVG